MSESAPEQHAYLAIFDHDGVLVDSLPFHERAWLELGRRENLDITVDFVRATFGMTNAMILERLLGAGLPPAEVARLGDLKEACYRDVARGSITLMSGVPELLDTLRNLGFQLGIGSSGPRANLQLTVTECGLQDHFTAIVGVEEIERGKPDPEVFLKVAGRARVIPRRTVVFEDAPVGVRAAKAAGMLAIGVGSTHPLETLAEAGADVLVPHLEGFDVSGLMERLTARSA